MYPVLLHLPGWLPVIGGAPIYSYGVMMVLGFFGALWLAKFLARRNGIDPEIFVNAGLIALVTGVIGARLSHVLENPHTYLINSRSAWENFRDAINIRSGGLTFYGGFLLATPCTIAYGMIQRVPIRLGMDIVAPCLMIGLGFGRIGCLLNGCCYGAECDLPWAMKYPYHSNAYVEQFGKSELSPPPQLVTEAVDRSKVLLSDQVVQQDPKLKALAETQTSRPTHPAQLYSTITAWLIAAFLVAYFTLPHLHGRVFALMLLTEAPSRFLLEMLRTEPAVVGRGSTVLPQLPPMSFSMVLSVGLLIGGVMLWLAFGAYARRHGETPDEIGQAMQPTPA